MLVPELEINVVRHEIDPINVEIARVKSLIYTFRRVRNAVLFHRWAKRRYPLYQFDVDGKGHAYIVDYDCRSMEDERELELIKAKAEGFEEGLAAI